jgi:hypothetical protein
MVLTSCDQKQNQLKGAIAVLLSLNPDAREQCNRLSIRKPLKGKKVSSGMAAQRSAKMTNEEQSEVEVRRDSRGIC